MLCLDALEHFSPEVWVCIGTRTPELDPRPFYRGREKLLLAYRRRWSDAQVACQREFTTGYGPRSGGRRRPHWNLMLKGIPSSDLSELREVTQRVWCGHVDAEPERQHVGAVYEAGGLGRYLALHFQKESQAPPEGWRGHRFTSSRGYFPEGTRVARERARSVIRVRRKVWNLEQAAAEQCGVIPEGLDFFEVAEGLLAKQAREESWELAHVQRESGDPAVVRHGEASPPSRRVLRAPDGYDWRVGLRGLLREREGV